MLLSFAAAAIAAVVDWLAVVQRQPKVERISKPLVMAALIVMALTIEADLERARWFMVAGLVCCLVGDVMLSPAIDRFLHGMGAFLVAHVFYIAAFATMELAFIGIVGGITAAAVLLAYLAVPTLRKVRGGSLFGPTVAYLVMMAVVVVFGTATHRWPIAIGGVLLTVSHGLLGLDRFVLPAPQRRVLVHMLYHLGHFGFVLGLAAG